MWWRGGGSIRFLTVQVSSPTSPSLYMVSEVEPRWVIIPRLGATWVYELCRGEINGDETLIGLPDVIWLVNFLFDKDRPAISCLGSGSINCWLPMPTKTCCKLP